jgi:uncharacterized cupredoxin-like copper-binding protein
VAGRALTGLALAGAGVLLLLAAATACGARAPAEATVTMRFSRFLPAEVTVPAGRPVTFTLRNDDPIEHEWIVGPPGVHHRHRTGIEPFHGEIPTEVTVPALEERTTVVTFERPGEYLYICHLPGHEAYGMVGVVRVVGR